MSTHVANKGMISYPDDPEFGTATPGKLAMWLFLVTDAMSFSGFLIGYGILRAGALDWPDPVKALGGVGLSGFMTFWLICSSVSMVFSIDACKKGDRKKMLKWLGLTIVGGFGFLAMQVYEYMHLFHDMGMSFASYNPPAAMGMASTNDLFSSTFFAITGFHGLHVLTGTLYLCAMYVKGAKGEFDNGNYNLIEICGLFWHFVDLVWILVFTFVYLL
ncbi:MAG: heme-copper oxidase subunit III [Halobacteriovoraceae bacterium]|jgi:cytochrome c oxidase subunit III|nr:heme-copper oxidase subunit III [Halobacteriovoraceae bacterium]MBT5093781.1 heme-copper oxidase subunit III [Halobacteriovoraceae bacterium]